MWRAWCVALMALGCVACGEASADNNGTVVIPGDNNGQQVDCPASCAQKAAACQAPAAQVDGLCAQFCGRGDAGALVRCLETSSCEALAEAFERGPETVCQTTAPDMGGQVDMGGQTDMGGGACAIGRRECEGDYDAFRCERSGATGGPVAVRERCAMPIPNVSLGTVCEDGWCVDARLPPVGSSCTDEFSCRRPNACQGGFCCQIEAERCTADDQCCGGMACVDTQFGYKVCGAR